MYSQGTATGARPKQDALRKAQEENETHRKAMKAVGGRRYHRGFDDTCFIAPLFLAKIVLKTATRCHPVLF